MRIYRDQIALRLASEVDEPLQSPDSNGICAGGFDGRKRKLQKALNEWGEAKLFKEDTLCWASMPGATREWMRTFVRRWLSDGTF